MAPDINLLPDEDRRAEERELRNPRSNSGAPVYSQPGASTPPPKPPAPIAAAPALPNVKPVSPPPITPPPAMPIKSVKPKVEAKPLGQQLHDLFGRFGHPAATGASIPMPTNVNLDVNLIPQETTTSSFGSLWPQIGAVLGSALVIAALFISLGLGVTAKEKSVAEAQAATAATAARLLEKQLVVEEMGRAVQQVRSVTGLLDGHIYWNQYFTWLESVTLPEVYYTGFMGDVTGTFTLSASARDYITLAQQLVVLRADPRVQQVSVAEASRDSQGWVNFTMSLTVSPSVFTRSQSL
jgi:hypothetical protein